MEKPETNVMRCFLQHGCNALHIYSLLCRMRVRKSLAMQLAKVWESFIHDLIYFPSPSRLSMRGWIGAGENSGEKG